MEPQGEEHDRKVNFSPSKRLLISCVFPSHGFTGIHEHDLQSEYPDTV